MSVVKSSLLFSMGTLISRISGLIRDQVVLAVFGASIYLDAFYVAYRIPNLLREMVAEGAMGSAFTKVYSSLFEEDRERAKKLLWDSLYFTFLLSLCICGIGILLAPYLVRAMTLAKPAGMLREVFLSNTTGLTRLLFPYLGMTIVGSIVMGALHQSGRFFLSAIAPIVFNIGNIIGALFFSELLEKYHPEWVQDLIGDPKITGLAIGVLVGGIGHFFLQLWGIWSSVFNDIEWKVFNIPWSEDLKKVLIIMIPAAVAASSGPINVLINTNFATSLGTGAVTWLNTAFRLLQLPVGIFGVAVGVAVLPRLARAIKEKDKYKIDKNVSLVFQQACEFVLWLNVPCMVVLLANDRNVIQILFQYGKFSPSDTVATANALFAYSFGIIGYGLIKVLTSFYYAVERTKYAMKVSIVSISVNFIGNYVLVNSYGHIGLATTASITLTFNSLVLIAGLRRHNLQIERYELLKSISCLVCASLLSVYFQKILEHWIISFFNKSSEVYPKPLVFGILTANCLIVMIVFAVFAGIRIRGSNIDINRFFKFKSR
ncbi:MAG: murein biosynthesis integral membrane protein MurJ [Oligoflexales bacterium]|nr:murein biosynthesis integral membrane protein MurJ [Oligoflexales bacterium]